MYNIQEQMTSNTLYTDFVFFRLQVPYFPTDNAHPKLFYIPFEVQITRT